MTELSCYRCLIENRGHVDAVTLFRGTAACEKCAREHAEELDEVARRASGQLAQRLGRT